MDSHPKNIQQPQRTGKKDRHDPLAVDPHLRILPRLKSIGLGPGRPRFNRQHSQFEPSDRDHQHPHERHYHLYFRFTSPSLRHT